MSIASYHTKKPKYFLNHDITLCLQETNIYQKLLQYQAHDDNFQLLFTFHLVLMVQKRIQAQLWLNIYKM